jgi:hypothetical protein
MILTLNQQMNFTSKSWDLELPMEYQQIKKFNTFWKKTMCLLEENDVPEARAAKHIVTIDFRYRKQNRSQEQPITPSIESLQ